MTKPFITNLVLLLLAASLALVIWLQPFSSPPPKPVLLTGVDPNSISAIRLTSGRELLFALEKRSLAGASTWYLSDPAVMPANSDKVKQLLELLSTDSVRQYEIKLENLAKLGLNPPGWEIALDETVIQFGKTEPIEQRRYVRVGTLDGSTTGTSAGTLVEATAGNTVHLINDRFSQYNFGSPYMLANLDILPVDKSVTEVHLPDKVVKRVDGQWQSTPSDEAISQSTFNEFIDEWRYAQALRVTLADKHASDKNAKPVTIYLEKAEQPVHLTVESTGQDFIITNKDWGVRYYLANNTGKRLLQIAPPTIE
ncbi:MAG TPA: DUF4340 domain-containing protein [Gammaproteobacteria bacterium]